MKKHGLPSTNQNQLNTAGRVALIAFAVLTQAFPAMAQAVYRIVDANGKVTFSDKPPVKGLAAPVATGAAAGAGSDAAAATLPYVLRQAMSKYPVTLYTGPDCGPCNAGRSLLQQRGIPFTERTSSNADDAAVLHRIFGDNAIPVLTVGSVTLKGLSESDWSQTLDLAGYPATSQLPATYRNGAATALAPPVAPKPAADKVSAPSTNDVPPPARQPNPSNPAGIQF